MFAFVAQPVMFVEDTAPAVVPAERPEMGPVAEDTIS